jgi:hypothetical protein
MATTKFNSIPSKILASSITAASTTFRLKDILGWDGVALTSADFGTVAWAVFSNAARTKIEIMEFDPATIASTDITINKRGMKYLGDLTTQVTANKLDWTKSDTFVQLGTDTPQAFQWLKEYIDGIAIAGAPDATTAIKGLVKMSVAPTSPTSPIAVGDNDGRVPTQGENDALIGGGYLGTPSSSNKFLTESARTTTQTFAASGTYTAPAGLKYARVRAWGAGGSGCANRSNSIAGGGGGGGYIERFLTSAEIGVSQTVTIGQGGAAVAVSTAVITAGNNGGNTTFGSLITAYGGTGAPAGGVSTTGGAGGNYFAQGGGTVDGGSAGPASSGGAGGDNVNSGGGGGGAASLGGVGGKSVFGGGGGGATAGGVNTAAGGVSTYGGAGGAGSFTTATSGSIPGGGGGGASNSTGTVTSGAGANGKIEVTEFYV